MGRRPVRVGLVDLELHRQRRHRGQHPEGRRPGAGGREASLAEFRQRRRLAGAPKDVTGIGDGAVLAATGIAAYKGDTYMEIVNLERSPRSSWSRSRSWRSRGSKVSRSGAGGNSGPSRLEPPRRPSAGVCQSPSPSPPMP